MNPITTVLVLLVAALLEAGGDALVRSGLHASTAVVRTLFFLIGSVVLFGYGYTVNVVPWDFGRLLGLYVVFFFVIVVFVAVPAGFVTSRSNVWAPGVSGPVGTPMPLATVEATGLVPSVITPVLPVGEKVPVSVVPLAQAGVVLAVLNVTIVGAANAVYVLMAGPAERAVLSVTLSSETR